MSNFAIDFRPKTLDEVYGTNLFGLKNYIRAQAKTGFKDTKAILLQGKYGCGKTTAASIISKMMVCQHPKNNGDPCNECPECKAVNDNLYNKSVVLLDAESLSKGDLKEQMDNLNTRPLGGKNKVIIIDEFQELSKEAKNMFLHVLEEKNKPYIHWIFTSMEAIPPSGIVSRMKKFEFKEPTQSQVAEFLMKFVTENSDENGLILEQLASFIPEDKIQDVLLDIAYKGNCSYRSSLQKLEEVILSKNTEVLSEASGTLPPLEFIKLCMTTKNNLNKEKLFSVSKQFQAWALEDSAAPGILAFTKYLYALYVGWLTGNTEVDPTINPSYLNAGIKELTQNIEMSKALKELASVCLSSDFQSIVYNFNIDARIKAQRLFMILLQNYFNMK